MLKKVVHELLFIEFDTYPQAAVRPTFNIKASLCVERCSRGPHSGVKTPLCCNATGVKTPLCCNARSLQIELIELLQQHSGCNFLMRVHKEAQMTSRYCVHFTTRRHSMPLQHTWTKRLRRTSKGTSEKSHNSESSVI